MDNKGEKKEFISILMESPFYFVLGLKERYDLLLRVMKIRQDNKIVEVSVSSESESNRKVVE